MRDTPARSPTPVSTSGARTFRPNPMATQSGAVPRHRVSMRMPASFCTPTYKSLGHFSPIGASANASSASAA